MLGGYDRAYYFPARKFLTSGRLWVGGGLSDDVMIRLSGLRALDACKKLDALTHHGCAARANGARDVS